MSLRDCDCLIPVISPDPRNHDPVRGRRYCLRCSAYIRVECQTNEATFAEFMQRLEEAMFEHGQLYGPMAPGPPAWFVEFREGCRERFLAGNSKFGYSDLQYLTRDNASEGCDEGTDGSNYAWFHILQQRQRGQDEEWALALTAAFHAAKLHEAMSHLRDRTHIPYSDVPDPA